MFFSFAPMEGITSYIFRKIHSEMFGGVDRYLSPFIAPDSSGNYKVGNLRDVTPENNLGITLIPQVLVNNPEPFLAVAGKLSEMGYKEVNLNVGCPSGTVVAKHKGAGMLADPQGLDNFLYEIFSRCELKISVKTRMGFNSTSEFPALTEIYNKYPIELLTVHARDKVGQYKSIPDIDGFKAALPQIKHPVEYNGNIFTAQDYHRTAEIISGVDGFMIGRGAVANPAVFREIRGGTALEKAELKEFHDRLMYAFKGNGLNDKFNMARLKELWHYMYLLFPECKKEIKTVNKSRTLDEYISAVNLLFSNCDMDTSCAELLQP